MSPQARGDGQTVQTGQTNHAEFTGFFWKVSQGHSHTHTHTPLIRRGAEDPWFLWKRSTQAQAASAGLKSALVSLRLCVHRRVSASLAQRREGGGPAEAGGGGWGRMPTVTRLLTGLTWTPGYHDSQLISAIRHLHSLETPSMLVSLKLRSRFSPDPAKVKGHQRLPGRRSRLLPRRERVALTGPSVGKPFPEDARRD